MMKNLTSVVCLLSLWFYQADTAFGISFLPVQLLEVGEFHADEVKARSGGRWLGLYASPDRSSLIPLTISVQPVFDPVVDENERQKTGRKVSVNRSAKPIFLVRGARMLRPGRVQTVHVGEQSLTNRSDIGLSLDGSNYRLRVVTKDQRAVEGISLDDAQLVISRGTEEQVLYSLNGQGRETEASWNLLWAGDIDGDRKLDLYIEVSDHYNVSERRLFLSSVAGRGRLMKQIGEFRTMGC